MKTESLAIIWSVAIDNVGLLSGKVDSTHDNNRDSMQVCEVGFSEFIRMQSLPLTELKSFLGNLR